LALFSILVLINLIASLLSKYIYIVGQDLPQTSIVAATAAVKFAPGSIFLSAILL
jgi:hypothetical protein